MFVTVVCSIQYRVVRQNADDAFYELQNPREQIQAYVFDGEYPEEYQMIISQLHHSIEIPYIFWFHGGVMQMFFLACKGFDA